MAEVVGYARVSSTGQDLLTVMDRKRREAWMRRHNLTRKHCR